MDLLQFCAQALRTRDQRHLGARVAAQRYRLGLARTAGSWSEILDHIDRAKPDVVSVDIFDTVLHRSIVGDHNVEVAICDVVAAAGLWPHDGASLLEARHAARAANPDGDARDWFSGAGLEDPAGALAIEAELECALAQPMPGIVESLDAIRAKGMQVCFTSDMHLPATVISQILSAVGALHENDDLVVSCDQGATKADGQLFAVLLQRYPGQEVVHVGNNKWSDGAQPIGYGIDSIFFPTANPTRYEHTFAEQGVGGGLIAGAARMTRLDGASEPALSVATGVLGQAMAAFSLWVQSNCAHEGIGQIAFCARDGELPHAMTGHLQSKVGDPLTLRYLHGNRSSLLLAGAYALGYDDWLAIGFATPGSGLRSGLGRDSFASTLARLGLSATNLAPGSDLSRRAADEPLGRENAPALRNLLEEPAIREKVLAQSEQSVDDHVAYLRSLDINEGRWAIVDIGWRGESAAVWSAIVERHTGQRPLTLHFGGNGTNPIVERHLDARRFAFDGEARPLPAAGITDAVETLSGTGKERLVSFLRRADGGVDLSMAPANDVIATPKRQEIHTAANRMTQTLANVNEALHHYLTSSDSLGDASARVFELFWTSPMRAEAQALGGMHYERDGEGETVVPIATPFRLTDLRSNNTVRLWGPASRSLSSPVMRLVVDTRSAARRAKKLRSTEP